MGGLCLGSIGLPRLRLSGTNPLRVYAALEVGIGIFGLLVLFVFPLIDRVYVAAVGHGLPGMLLRALMAVVCMLPATVLMGASLPAIVRWVERRRAVSPDGACSTAAIRWERCSAAWSRDSICYACTTSRLRPTPQWQSISPWQRISYTLAARAPAESAVFSARRKRRSAPPSSRPIPNGRSTPPSRSPVSCALGAEVVWTRLMGMMLGATVYVFSIILAVFLIGMALGSAAGSWLLAPRQCALSAWAGARCCWRWPSPGPAYMISRIRCLTGHDRSSTPARGRRLRSIPGPLPVTRSFRPRCCGARVSLRFRRSRTVRKGIRHAWWAASTRPTRWAQSSARSSSAWCWFPGSERSTRSASCCCSPGSAQRWFWPPYARRFRSKPVALALTVSLVLSGILASRVRKIPGELIAYGRRVP